MNDPSIFQVAIIPRNVGWIFTDDADMAKKIQKAFSDHLVFDVSLKGKHSKGAAVAYDPDDDEAFLLKPGYGNNSPALGVNDTNVSQSRREVAFSKVGQKFVNPHSYVGAGLLTLDGHEVSVLDLLPSTYVNAQKIKKQIPIHEVMKPYFDSGEAWKWSFLDFVLGNPDRHGGNILVDPENGHVTLIDHSSAFAGPNFNPGFDQNSFVPYYLRAAAPANFQTMSADQKYKQMAQPNKQDEDEFKAWLRAMDKFAFFDTVARYGIPTDAIRQRFHLIAMSDDPLMKLNRLWAGLESPQSLKKTEGLDPDSMGEFEDWWSGLEHLNDGYKVAKQLGMGWQELYKQVREGTMPEATQEMFLQVGDVELAPEILKTIKNQDQMDRYVGMYLNAAQEKFAKMKNAAENEQWHYRSEIGKQLYALSYVMNDVAGGFNNGSRPQIQKPEHVDQMYHLLQDANKEAEGKGEYPSLAQANNVFIKRMMSSPKGSTETLRDFVKTLPHQFSNLHPGFEQWQKVFSNDPQTLGDFAVKSGAIEGVAAGYYGEDLSPEFKSQLWKHVLKNYSNQLSSGVQCAAASKMKGEELAEWWQDAPSNVKDTFAQSTIKAVPDHEIEKAFALNGDLAAHGWMRWKNLRPDQREQAFTNMADNGWDSIRKWMAETGEPPRSIPHWKEVAERMRYAMDRAPHLDAQAQMFIVGAIPTAIRSSHHAIPLDVSEKMIGLANNFKKVNHISGPLSEMSSWYRSINDSILDAYSNIDVRALNPEFIQNINRVGSSTAPGKLTSLIETAFTDAPWHASGLMDALVNDIHATGNDQVGLLSFGSNGPNSPLVKHLTPQHIETFKSMDPNHPKFQQAQRVLHELNPPEVSYSVGSGKLRKLRTFLSQQPNQAAHKDALKQAGFDVGSHKLGPLLDSKGNLSHKALDKHINSLPTQKFNYLHRQWGGAQRHSSEPSKVFAVMATPEHLAELDRQGVRPVFDALNQSSSSGHPTIKGRGVGWVRYTHGNDGVHIDEIQTDFGPNFIDQLKRLEALPEDQRVGQAGVMATNAQKKGITAEAVQKINKVFFGDQHPNRAMHEAFLQHLRDNGQVGKKVHIWDVAAKAKMNLEGDKQAPGHYMHTYKTQPEKMGYQPSTYGKLETQTNDALKQPENEAPTWEDTIHKKETDYDHFNPFSLDTKDSFLHHLERARTPQDIERLHRLRAAYFWHSFEEDTRGHHIAAIRKFLTGKPGLVTIVNHKGEQSDNSRWEHIEDGLRLHRNMVQHMVLSDHTIPKKMINGVPHVPLYRGVAGNMAAKVALALTQKDAHKVAIPIHDVSSWSLDPYTAVSFAQSCPSNQARCGLTMRKWIPIHQIVNSGIHEAVEGQSHPHRQEKELVVASHDPHMIVNREDVEYRAGDRRINPEYQQLYSKYDKEGHDHWVASGGYKNPANPHYDYNRAHTKVKALHPNVAQHFPDWGSEMPDELKDESNWGRNTDKWKTPHEHNDFIKQSEDLTKGQVIDGVAYVELDPLDHETNTASNLRKLPKGQ